MTCEWSDWFNLGAPTTGPNGGEDESIQKIRADGHDICSAPEDVQCRATLYPTLPIKDLGQTITCNSRVGLVCENKMQTSKQDCLDYEIRVRCCTCRPITTTTTPSITTTAPPITRPVVTTTPTTTAPTTTTIPTTPSTTSPTTKTTPVPSTETLVTVTTSTTTTTITTTASPTTTTVSTTPLATTSPTAPNCSGIMTCDWSDWFNLGEPTTGPNGGEDESIQKIIAAGHSICSAPEDVQCRASLYPNLPLSDVGQAVTCNSVVGLVCQNNEQGLKQQCLDYEIRVRCCSCHHTTSTTSPTTTITTTTVPPTTTPVSTTTPTKTSPTSTTKPTTTPFSTTTTPTTTACLGIMTCEWSDWFNLGAPTTGPNGGEDESIQKIRADGHDICSAPEDVQCRATLYPTLPIKDLGQTITCNSRVGLVCENKMQTSKQDCLDYEIRVKCCNCRPFTTTTTPISTITPLTTTTVTTTTPPTITSPTSKTMSTPVPPTITPIATTTPTTKTPTITTMKSTLVPHTPPPVPTTKPSTTSPTTLTTTTTTVPTTPTTTLKTLPTTTPMTTPESVVTHSTSSPTHAPICVCKYNGTAYEAGSMIYNVSDHGAWCYTAYCKYINKTCLVVTTKPSYCKESTTAVPTTTESSTQHRSSSRPSTTTQQPTTKFVAKSCVNWNPPKKSGESWKESPCVNATCLDGIVTTYTTECKKQEPMVCANNFPATLVYDEDGCCPHYECQCICYGWGDPHYVTFDGTYYGFQGNCSYVLVKEIHPKYNFSVVIENYYCDAEDGLSCPQSLTVYYQQYTIFITHKDINGVPINMVFVDGLRVNPAFKNKDFGLATTGIDTVLFIESIGARITFSGLMFSVYLPYEEFNHNTEGQCGTCDNNRTNDCMLPSGEIALSCPYMAHEWQLNNSVCMHPPTPTPSPTTPVPVPPCKASLCEIISSSVFGKCHDVVPFEPFMVACNFDVCNMEIDIIGCTSIQTYAMACAEAGVCIDWRNATDGICEYTCGSPKVYEACGPWVEPTCDYRYNYEFIYNKNFFTALTSKKCEGCYCPPGSVQLNIASNICVPSCDICVLKNDEWKMVNETWEQGCDVCTCLGRENFTCQHIECPILPPLSCVQEGQIKVTETGECCPKQKCECNLQECKPIPPCPPGYNLTIQMGACCPKPECVPPKPGVCVYGNHTYQVGDQVNGPRCEECICTAMIDHSTKLNEVQCKPIPCDTLCTLGYEYQTIAGHCCGKCVQTSCIAVLPDNTTNTFLPGSIWTAPGFPCLKFECLKIGNQLVTIEAKIVCPPYNPSDCIPGTETLYDGCCYTCMRHDQCNLTTTAITIENMGCLSKELINMTSCGGACGTFTYYSSQMRSLEHTCTCCREMSTSERTVRLICPDSTEVDFTYEHINTCGCLKTECAAAGHAASPGVLKSSRRRR